MNIGSLCERIVIQYLATGYDEYGEESGTWTEFATVWAAVMDEHGGESFPNRERIAENMTMFKIRYLADVTPKMRILWNGLEYDILSTKRIGRRVALEIKASAQVR